jgi:hypothetical protein
MSDVRGSHSLALIGRVEQEFQSRNWRRSVASTTTMRYSARQAMVASST